MLTLTFFHNTKGAPVSDLYHGERRLLATTHPATIVGAMFAMERTRLKVVTSLGAHTGDIKFLEADADFPPLPVLKLRMQLNPRLYQFKHLSPAPSYELFLEGLDLFSYENWHEPNDQCDEYIRIAYHHLPADVIKRPLLKPAPKDWKKTLKKRNMFIYYPFC